MLCGRFNHAECVYSMLNCIANLGFYMQALIPLWGYMPIPKRMMTWLCLCSGASSSLESTPARYTICTLALCQQGCLTAPCNNYTCLRMPKQIVCTVLAIQQDHSCGVHDETAWKAPPPCDVVLQAVRDTEQFLYCCHMRAALPAHASGK